MAEKKITRKQTGARIDSEKLKSLKHLAVETERSLNSLLEEAINDILKKYSKHSIKR